MPERWVMVMARDRGQRENQRLRPRSGPRVHEDSPHTYCTRAHQDTPGSPQDQLRPTKAPGGRRLAPMVMVMVMVVVMIVMVMVMVLVMVMVIVIVIVMVMVMVMVMVIVIVMAW